MKKTSMTRYNIVNPSLKGKYACIGAGKYPYGFLNATVAFISANGAPSESYVYGVLVSFH